MKARDNPFAIDRIERLLEFEPSWCGESWPSIFERWEAFNRQAAIVGPHGSGKTTFLRGFESRLDARGKRLAHFFLNDRKSSLSADEWQRIEACAVDPGTVISLDGAERLGWRSWRRFVKFIGAGSALVTRHRQARWPTLLNTQSSAALLAHLIDQVAPHSVEDDEVDALFERHRGNLREALWECYDRAGEFAADRRKAQCQRNLTTAAISNSVTAPKQRTHSQ